MRKHTPITIVLNKDQSRQASDILNLKPLPNFQRLVWINRVLLIMLLITNSCWMYFYFTADRQDNSNNLSSIDFVS